MSESEKSVAHRGDMNQFGTAKWPDGLVPWDPASAPDLNAPYPESQYRTTGRLRSCGYCGSMHPTDLVAAIKAGARVHWADQKYGWPHKIYVDDIPNPHAGMLESRSFTSRASAEEIQAGKWVKYQTGYNARTGEPEYGYREPGKPASATTYGKFYSVHLQDATPEDRAVIERAMGRSFLWHEGKMWFGPYHEGGLTAEVLQCGLARQEAADKARAEQQS